MLIVLRYNSKVINILFLKIQLLQSLKMTLVYYFLYYIRQKKYCIMLLTAIMIDRHILDTSLQSVTNWDFGPALES